MDEREIRFLEWVCALFLTAITIVTYFSVR